MRAERWLVFVAEASESLESLERRIRRFADSEPF
jgi:hypothetical protein